jgi:ParB family chromosome partitioning protein
MLIPIDSIRESSSNARAIAASAEADAALIASMRAIGLLQPILVARRSDQWWQLRAGHRRLAAARALDWTDIAAVEIEVIPGMEDAIPETAISAAENMVRAAMHPVDQWRAIVDLRTSSGYALETAAAALGVALPLARRMELLGSMAPAVLDAVGQGDLPSVGTLRSIASAPHDVQTIAIERAHAAKHGFRWGDVADACTVHRIPRTRAIFDHALLAWDEDLFAEADDADRFTTADIDGFMALQRKAIEARVAKSKGRIVLGATREQYYRIVFPKGWQQSYGAIPKRFTKNDPRKLFLMLVEDGYDIGAVSEVLGEPAKAAAHSPAGERDTPPRPALSKPTLRLLAEMKAEAVRARLSMIAIDHDPADMLTLLLMCFTFRNVGVTQAPLGMKDALARRLIGDEGLPLDLAREEVGAIAADLIGQMVAFDAPDIFASSGPAAEWLAEAIGAEMPRTDTPEVLKGITGDRLAEIAETHGISAHGKVGDLRKRLAGALADWRAVTFGAPGPMAEPELDDASDTDDGEEQQDMGEAA